MAEDPKNPNPIDPPAPDPAAQKKDQPIIDPARVEELLETNAQLQTRVSELEKTTKKTVTSAQPKGWDQVQDNDLEYIITHPTEYPDHVQGAFKELRQRDRASVKNEVTIEANRSQFMGQHKEAFDPNSPLGKEVGKILGQNGQGRAESDVLADVVELAQLRMEKGKGEKKGRQDVVNNLKAANAHSPGSDSINELPAPSFMDMPKDEFEKQVQKVKMKSFK